MAVAPFVNTQLLVPAKSLASPSPVHQAIRPAGGAKQSVVACAKRAIGHNNHKIVHQVAASFGEGSFMVFEVAFKVRLIPEVSPASESSRPSAEGLENARSVWSAPGLPALWHRLKAGASSPHSKRFAWIEPRLEDAPAYGH